MKIKVCSLCGIYHSEREGGNWKNWDHKCRMHMIEVEEELCIIRRKKVIFMDFNPEVVAAKRIELGIA